MTTKRTVAAIGFLLIAGAYVAGYWPEHSRFTRSDTERQALQAVLDRADARLRVGEILGLLLQLNDAVAVRNFGQAATLSSAYFDRVRQEAPKQQGEPRLALDHVLQSRDEVTAALARTDQSVSASLQVQQRELRKALGYPVDEVPPPQPPSK